MTSKNPQGSKQAKIVEHTKDGNIRTTFDEPKVTNGLRALQIWQILIGKANNRQLITYKDLAGLMGYEGKGVQFMRAKLGPIYYYCQNVGLPPLTALVVNMHSGIPGKGFKVRKPEAQREKVFNFEWYKRFPPSVGQLQDAKKIGRKKAKAG